MKEIYLTKKMLAGIILISFMAGIVAAGSMGYGPLAYISFHIESGGGGGGGSLITTPAYIDLGNLTAGSSGSTSATATLEVPSYGKYEFKLENESELKRVFSSFTVTVDVDGAVVVLDLYGDDSRDLYLNPGTYTVSITIDYTVKSNPQQTTVSNMLFLQVEQDSS